MSTYINTDTNEYSITVKQIKALYPNVSFPAVFVPPSNFKLVFDTPKPIHDTVTRQAIQTPPVLTSKGHYEQSWEIVPKFVEYTDDEGTVRTVVEQEASVVMDSIARLVSVKKEDIRSDFALAIASPVEALGFTWNSGFNSSLSIDGAARIALAAGLTEVTIHSLDNKPHMLSLADATQVAVIIGGAYQQQLAIKQARMVAVDEVDVAASDAVQQISAI
jgi:hypothetical protein